MSEPITITITIDPDDYVLVARMIAPPQERADITMDAVAEITDAHVRVVRSIVDAVTALPEPGEDEHAATIVQGHLYAWQPRNDQAAALVAVLGFGDNGEERFVTCKVLADAVDDQGRYLRRPQTDPIQIIPEARFLEAAHRVHPIPLSGVFPRDAARDGLGAAEQLVDVVVGQDHAIARRACGRLGINPDKAVGASGLQQRLEGRHGTRVHITDPFTSADAYKRVVAALTANAADLVTLEHLEEAPGR